MLVTIAMAVTAASLRQYKALITVVVLSAALAGLPNSASAHPAEKVAATTPEQLAQLFVKAVRSKDPANIKALIHPAVLVCANETTREYFDYILDKDLEDAPSENYKITVTETANNSLPPGLPEGLFQYPVKPTRQFQIDWNPTAYKSVTVIRAVAAQNGKWFLVYPCPNAAGMKAFHDMNVKRREQQEHARSLAGALKPQRRYELLALLKQGRKIDAVKKYQSWAGVDLTTAMQVMDVLETAPQ